MADTKTFTLKIDGVETSIKNVVQLETAVEKLQDQIKNADLGSAEYEALRKQIVKARTEVEKFEQGIENFSPEKKLETVAKLGESMAGAFGLATAGASLFGKELGLSEETIAKYQQSVDACLLGLQSYKSLMEGISGENLKNIKNLIGMRQAQEATTGATEAGAKGWKIFGNAGKLALASIGIGLLIVALVAIYANFDKLKKVVLDFANSFEPVKSAIDYFTNSIGSFSALFSGILQAGKNVFSALGSVVLNFGKILLNPFETKNYSNFVASVKNIGKLALVGFAKGVAEQRKEIADELANTLLQAQIEANKRYVQLVEAQGKDSYALKKKILNDELEVLKSALKKEEDVTSDSYKEKKKAVLDKETEIGVLVASKKKEIFDKSLEVLKRNQEAELAIQNTQLERQKALLDNEKLKADERKAILKDALEQELNLLKENAAQQLKDKTLTDKEKSKIAEETFTQELAIKKSYNNQLLAVDKEEKEKVKEKADFEIEQINKVDAERLRAITNSIDNEKLSIETRIDAVERATELEISILNKQKENELSKENITAAEKLAIQAKYQNDTIELVQAGANKIEELLASKKISFFDSLFGEGFTEASTAVLNTSVELLNNYLAVTQEAFDAQLEDLDSRIEDSSERMEKLTSEFEESTSKINDLESELLDSRSTKRAIIIQQLEAERVKNAQIAAEKAKQEAQLKQDELAKQELEKKRQKQIEITTKLQQAATLVTQVNTAVEAVGAGIKAVSSASAVPFPGNLIAIVAAIAAVGSAVLSAKALTSKLEKGGFVNGPSHAQGGVRGTGRFSNIEVEGGEFVTNKRATANNASVLDTINRFGDTTRFKVTPYANGGTLPDFGSISQSVAVQADPTATAVLAQLMLLNQTNVALANRPVNVNVKEVTSAQDRVASIKESGLN